tara:strand:+ start:362 stop:727 length:366 start_codon:yes stop_codon:yes gene_type:complete
LEDKETLEVIHQTLLLEVVQEVVVLVLLVVFHHLVMVVMGVMVYQILSIIQQPSMQVVVEVLWLHQEPLDQEELVEEVMEVIHHQVILESDKMEPLIRVAVEVVLELILELEVLVDQELLY